MIAHKKPIKKRNRPMPLWPLDAPGMAVPGEAFLQAAKIYGGKKPSVRKLRDPETNKLYEVVSPTRELERVIRKALYGGGSLVVNLEIKNKVLAQNIISGHRWGANVRNNGDGTGELGPSLGPERCDVMVIGKMLGDQELSAHRHMRGPTSLLFLQTCQKLGLPNISKWYVTNVFKSVHPEGEGTLKQGWVNQHIHLLQQEIRLVKPKYILCLGADAVKAVLGKKATFGKVDGTIVDYELDVRKSASDPPKRRQIKVMACLHPAQVAREPKLQSKFRDTVGRFGQMLDGKRWDKEDKNVEHVHVYDEIHLREVLDQAIKENPERIIGVDAEWDGQHPQNDGAYLRCVQISWAHKKAACIAIRKQHNTGANFKRAVRDENGDVVYELKDGKRVPKLTYKGGFKVLRQLLNEYFDKCRIFGHFVVSDLEQLEYYGFRLMHRVLVPDDWRKCKSEGGGDTAYMAHAADETDDYDLMAQAMRYTDVHRYDLPVDEFLTDYCKKRKIKRRSLTGYGCIPDDVLYPYACWDADVTRRLVIKHRKRLTRDRYGNNCWEAYWTTMRALPAIYEINTTGLELDRNRVDELVRMYVGKKRALLHQLRTWANWGDGDESSKHKDKNRNLNMNSTFHVRELLFGEALNGKPYIKKTIKLDGKAKQISYPNRLRPEGARTLLAVPVITTEKRPTPWEQVIEDGKESEFTPSTNRMALGIMWRDGKNLPVRRNGKIVTEDHEQVLGWIRDYRFIDQVLKSSLRVPKKGETGSYIEDENGNYTYTAGIAGSACSDGRVRTYIVPVKETGRWASSRPPLQNLSKRREEDYARILADLYKYPLRSILRAPEGYALVESDFKGAELFGMAIMSGCELMLDHVLRNQLPEDDPNFYDIHSAIAVLAFGFNCEPTKKGLKSIGKAYMRIVAKAVVFGVAYGRGAKAIALAAREEGVRVTVEEAQQVIDTIFKLYPELLPFFQECRERAASEEPGVKAPLWLCGPFGRFRRFEKTDDRRLIGDNQRQAMNFPIQGMIADVVNRAVDHIITYRNTNSLGFKIALQIHDALVFMVPYAEVPHVIDYVVPEIMCRKVPIVPCSLDGVPKEGATEYYLGSDSDLFINWGQHMLPNECIDRRIDPKYAGWEKHPSLNGFVSGNFYGKLWQPDTGRLHKLLTDKAGNQLTRDTVSNRIKKRLAKQHDDVEAYLSGLKDDDLLQLVTDDKGLFRLAL